MIKNNNENYITIKGTNGAEVEVEKYKVNSKAVFNSTKDTEITISINQCEVIDLNKEDALAIANKILELLG